MTSRDAVAIMLASAILSAVFLSSGAIKHLLGYEQTIPLEPSLVSAWENLLFTIIGALSGYITGKNSE